MDACPRAQTAPPRWHAVPCGITSVISEKSRNKDLPGVRDSYAIAAVMPRGKPARQLTKLKRKRVAETAVHEFSDSEPFGPLFESVRPRTRFTLPTHG